MKDYFVNGNVYTVREAACGWFYVNVNEEVDKDGDLTEYCFNTELEALQFILKEAEIGEEEYER